MTNGKFTIFGLKNGEPAWAEELLVDTTDENLFNRCMEIAPKKGYKITRVYKPETKLSAPDFTKAINV